LQRGARGNCPRCPPLNPALRMGDISLSAHLIAELFLPSVQNLLNVGGNCGKNAHVYDKRCPIQKIVA